VPPPRDRADYDALGSIALRFLLEGESTGKVANSLDRGLRTLRRGDRFGSGATAYYREMDATVMPSLKRLENALTEAGAVTPQIAQLVRQPRSRPSQYCDTSESDVFCRRVCQRPFLTPSTSPASSSAAP